MRHLAAALMLAASPAAASNLATSDLSDFFGGHGCTIGPDSTKAARGAGFSKREIKEFTEEALEAGQASEQRDYVVLDAVLCQIRLPKVATSYTLKSPEIKDTVIRRTGQKLPNENGCFTNDLNATFATLHPEDSGISEYFAFLSAHLSSGDLRFLSPDILRSPYSFQVMTGDCADMTVPTAFPISDESFDAYMRVRFASTNCAYGWPDLAPVSFTHEQQNNGVDANGDVIEGWNVYRHLEYDFIAMGAGWREGLTWSDKGTERPPMCHYAD